MPNDLAQQDTLAKLKTLRTKTNLSLRPTKHLKTTFTDLKGDEVPLVIRYYQVQGVLHLIVMKRFVLGDDTGLGKTLQVIAALCYLWEKDPQRKAIILTTKSATRQWVDEFGKFTTGVSVFTCSGTPAQRKAIYKQFKACKGPTVMVMGYRTLVQDFTILQNWKDFVLAADECFDYFTPVTLADGSTELIGKIVCGKLPVEVMSWNKDTGALEPKKVVNWFRNPLTVTRPRKLWKVDFRLSNSVRVTASHDFYTPGDIKVPVQRLRVGSPVQHLCPNAPTATQWQVILGSLLGDASISTPNRNSFGVVFTQTSKRAAYTRFKRDLLVPLGVSEIESSTSGYQPVSGEAKAPVERFHLNRNADVISTLIQGRVWRDGKKRVTMDWLDLIEPLGLAFWYADDGSLGTNIRKDGSASYHITLNTQGFSRDEQELLAGWLRWKWGILAEIKTSKPRSDREGAFRTAYSHLYLPDEEARKFLDLLPGALPDVEYKFPNKPLFQWAPQDIQPTPKLVTDWVISKKVFVPQENQKYVYDMEVEGNHNYFAGGALVSNCVAFKNPKTQVHQVCRHMGSQADRVWGLTATLIKNTLMEGYGIYQVILPDLFSMSYNSFMMYYALTKQQSIGGNRHITVVTGYHPDKIREFRENIDPYFIGRPKHEVASELPSLTSKIIEVDLNQDQIDKYDNALEGLLEMGRDDKLIEKEVTKLSAIAYCQEIVNHLELIDCEGGSSKLEAIVDLLTDAGEFDGEKVIIFSRFEKMISLVMSRLKAEKVSAVRVTGRENMDQRKAAMDAFQSPHSDVRVICITTAGSEAINLQAAKAIICIDTPWSAGEFIQLIGRMIRIGSKHDKCYVVHLVARKGKGKNGETIDHRVMEVLGKKMVLVEAVLGKRIKGEGDEVEISVENDLSNLFAAMKQDAREARLGDI